VDAIPSVDTQSAPAGTAMARLRAADNLDAEVVEAYQQHSAGLFRYAVVIVHNRESAQDAVQEIFLRYFVVRSQGQTIQNCKAWLFRVLRNHLLDSLKSASTKNEIGMEHAGQSVDAAQDPELTYHHTELARRIWSTLAPRELECLRLRNEGFCYEEIAEILSVRTGTVGALLTRAQKKIRKILDHPAPALAGRLVDNPC